ncbi:hypothetical protein [Halococcus salifodinae]|uniref:hypothetical protein n=1 Tax=Halococcus salifodinae TaxID=36738 RepID=UPI00126970F7|nr:hypothetical protein [Halococcus salifodinae]
MVRRAVRRLRGGCGAVAGRVRLWRRLQSGAGLADEGRASGGANGVSTVERANGEERPVSE